MSDIVERLRSKATDCHEVEGPLYLEAADEIERLRSPWMPVESAPITATEQDRYAGHYCLVFGPKVGVCAGTLHRLPDRKPTVSVGHLGGDAVEHWGVTHYTPLPAPPASTEPT